LPASNHDHSGALNAPAALRATSHNRHEDRRT
jgi:hypothetical protein